MKRPTIAIIGAGMSGLTLAHELADFAEVTVFEKSKGVGGRMATRRASPVSGIEKDQQRGPEDKPIFVFDHGTQFFTAKTSEFKTWLEPFQKSGLIAEWTGKVLSLDPGKPLEDRPWPEPHYVAVPQMNALAKHLAGYCKVIFETEVAPLSAKQQDGWPLWSVSGEELGRYDWVISTAPPVQTVLLFSDFLPQDSPLAKVTMQGCFTLMLAFDRAWDRDWIAVKVRNHPIEWIAVNSSKPGRRGENWSATTIVVHSNNAWAQDHIDDDLVQTKAYLLEQLSSLALFNPGEADHIDMHRWRYALKVVEGGSAENKAEAYLDPSLQLASTGDWCVASRIEDVWLSACRLARQIAGLPGG